MYNYIIFVCLLIEKRRGLTPRSVVCIYSTKSNCAYCKVLDCASKVHIIAVYVTVNDTHVTCFECETFPGLEF